MNYILKNLVIGLSKLPLWTLYILSDFIFFIHNNFKGYRKDVVEENLTNSFPNKSKKEIKQLSNQFFKNFYDFPIESIKGISLTQEYLDKRIRVENLDVMHKYYAQNRDVMVLCGHVFNWEWIKGLGAHLPQKNVYAVFSVPKDKLTNDLIKKGREHFGAETIPMYEATKTIMGIPNEGNSIFFMVADQSPHKTRIKYDLTFLNQTTPVFQGFDKIARRKDMGVVYINVTKEKRGKYVYTVHDILPDNDSFKENEIVHKFFSLLETNIKENPSNYMWTHKRWKYKKGIDY